MNSKKKKQFDCFIEELGRCTRCSQLKKQNGKDCSLINIYQDFDFGTKIPSIWTDWYRRLDADIMIIGQDWGPYEEMKKFHDCYLKEETLEHWIYLIEEERSLTKKLLKRYLIESSSNSFSSSLSTDLDQMFVTNAILCARKGSNYRGDNIQLRKSTFFCTSFLKKQIDIVHPKIILTLGYYPLYALSLIFHFEIEDNLTKTIEKSPIIVVSGYKIIPLYHPTAQISKNKQLIQYRRIWEGTEDMEM